MQPSGIDQDNQPVKVIQQRGNTHDLWAGDAELANQRVAVGHFRADLLGLHEVLHALNLTADFSLHVVDQSGNR